MNHMLNKIVNKLPSRVCLHNNYSMKTLQFVCLLFYMYLSVIDAFCCRIFVIWFFFINAPLYHSPKFWVAMLSPAFNRIFSFFLTSYNNYFQLYKQSNNFHDKNSLIYKSCKTEQKKISIPAGLSLSLLLVFFYYFLSD